MKKPVVKEDDDEDEEEVSESYEMVCPGCKTSFEVEADDVGFPPFDVECPECGEDVGSEHISDTHYGAPFIAETEEGQFTSLDRKYPRIGDVEGAAQSGYRATNDWEGLWVWILGVGFLFSPLIYFIVKQRKGGN